MLFAQQKRQGNFIPLPFIIYAIDYTEEFYGILPIHYDLLAQFDSESARFARQNHTFPGVKRDKNILISNQYFYEKPLLKIKNSYKHF